MQLLSTDAAMKGAGMGTEETVKQISRERIIGSSELVDIKFLELAISIGRAVARLQIGSGLGTGFLVGPGLILTNHHVIESVDDATIARAQFDFQTNAAGEMLATQEYRLNPGRFFLTDEKLDFTLVAIEKLSDKGRPLSEYPWLPMIAQTGKAAVGDPLNIIQHPRGGLKQIAFRENKVIELPSGTPDFLYYSTDTEPGSSGSPCFNDQWELIALHHSGVPKMDKGNILQKNGKPWKTGVDPEGLIDWVANEGARISALVAAINSASLPGQAKDLRDAMLHGEAPNPVELARKSLLPASSRVIDVPAETKVERPQGVIANMGQSVTLTIPLNITFSIGEAAGTAVSAPAVPAAAPAIVAAQPVAPIADAVEVTIDQNWAGRKGYDANFLGFQVPLPKLTAAQLKDTAEVPPPFRIGGDKNVLAYHHYSVAMCKSRRTAWYSAGMIDGTRFINFPRGKDKWFLDPRIDSKLQMGEELYVGASTDRGHLTRFKDLSWGANMAEAVNATNDSFHFTNCTLQLSGFNQGKDRWQGLEQFLLEQHAKQDQRKMVVITGPVLRTTDPKYKNDSMNYTAQIPLAFWKICVLKRKDGTTAATAFTLGQEDITALPGFEEKFDVALAQVTIADLEKTTGLSFGDLKKNDHFAKSKKPGTLEVFRADGGSTNVKPIEDFSDIEAG